MSTGERLLFVIGAPRSGTTLLMRMLNVHPDVATRPEPHLLTPLAHLGYFARVDKAPYDPFQSAEAAKAFVADLPGGEADYVDACRAYADILYDRMLSKTPEKRVFLDKTPAYALSLPFLARLYPDAAYVVLTRHPFAVFSSYAKSFFDDDWAAAHAFNPVVERYVPAIARFLESRPCPRTYHVRYEALVADPAQEMRAICEVAGLTYTDDLVEYGKKGVEGEGLGDPIGVHAHDRPVRTSVEKWAKEVVDHPDRIALLETMLAGLDDDALATWGYDRAAVWDPLRTASPSTADGAKKRALRWDRHHAERRALLWARKALPGTPAEGALERARLMIDVLLRDKF